MPEALTSQLRQIKANRAKLLLTDESLQFHPAISKMFSGISTVTRGEDLTEASLRKRGQHLDDQPPRRDADVHSE